MTVHDRIEKIKKGASLEDFEDKDITYGMCLAAIERRPYAGVLDTIPKRFLTEELYLKGICEDERLINSTPLELFTDKFVLKLIKAKGAEIISSLPKQCKTGSFLLPIIKAQPDLLYCIPKSARTAAVCKVAIQSMGYKSETDAIKKKPELMGLFHKSLYTHDACLAFVESDYFKNHSRLGDYWRGKAYWGNTKTELPYIYIESSEGFSLFVSPEPLLRWEDVCWKALAKWPYLIACVDKNVLNNEMCEYAIEQSGYSIEYIPNELKTKKICDIAFRYETYLIEFIPEEYVNESMCKKAISENADNLKYIPKKHITKELIKTAIKKARWEGFVSSIPPELFDKEIALLLIQQLNHTSCVLKNAPESTVDYDVCLAAVKKDGESLKCVPKEFLTEELYLNAVKSDNYMIRFVPEEQRSYNMYLEACKCEKPRRVMDHISEVAQFCYSIPNEYWTVELITEGRKSHVIPVSYIPFYNMSEDIILEIAPIIDDIERYLPDKYKTKKFLEKLEKAKKSNNT